MESSEESCRNRKLSFTGSTSSKSSSFINVEDDAISEDEVGINEGKRILSMLSDTDLSAYNSPLNSSFGSASDVSEVETVVDSDCEETQANDDWNYLLKRFFKELQDLLKKQDPKDPLFDIIFSVENKEIYAHMLILHLCGAKELIKFIEKNGSKGKIKKVDMNNIEGNKLSYDEMYIFTKSLYFNNVENDLTATNVMLLLRLGKTFGIKHLVNDCKNYLNGSKWEEDALILLEKAISFLDTEIVTKCLNLISKNTEKYLFSSKFLEIKHATLIQLLNQKCFKTDAKTLYDKVFDWATKNSCLKKEEDSLGDIYRETLGEALNLIPFKEMNPNQIFEICEIGVLTPAEALSYLKEILAKNESTINTTPNLNALNHDTRTQESPTNDQISGMPDPSSKISSKSQSKNVDESVDNPKNQHKVLTKTTKLEDFLPKTNPVFSKEEVNEINQSHEKHSNQVSPKVSKPIKDGKEQVAKVIQETGSNENVANVDPHIVKPLSVSYSPPRSCDSTINLNNNSSRSAGAQCSFNDRLGQAIGKNSKIYYDGPSYRSYENFTDMYRN